MTDNEGHVEPEHMPMWNVTNALLAMCDGLQNLERRLKSIEQSLQR
jgi:hypothetical protein